MEPVTLYDNVYWVGAIDWDVREFHGYSTTRGTTYNAYLIKGNDRIALVDTVKAEFFPEMMSAIQRIVDPGEIDYVVVNHVEMDHSGSLVKLLEHAPKAEVIATANGVKGLGRHYRIDAPIRQVKSGAELSLGDKNLLFLEAYMLHWPDSMFTYLKEDALLLSNDGFGQHYASNQRFDDEGAPLDIVMEEAAKYFANILMPLAPLIPPLLKKVQKMGIPINMIAPSHGIIWRSHIDKIIGAYSDWSVGKAEKRALVIYDTMWGSTEKMARSISEGMNEAGLENKIISLKKNHYSDVMKEILTASILVFGSPTLNEGIFPSMAQLLSYVKGLRPLKKKGAAFGSYGWGGEAIEAMNREMKAAGIEVVDPGLGVIYKPQPEDLEACFRLGRRLAQDS